MPIAAMALETLVLAGETIGVVGKNVVAMSTQIERQATRCAAIGMAIVPFAEIHLADLHRPKLQREPRE